MIYEIYFDISNNECFNWPCGFHIPRLIGKDNLPRIPEILATYDTRNNNIVLDNNFFNWNEFRNDWEQEINRVIGQINKGYNIWYCLTHGDCHIVKSNEVPLDPCNTNNACIPEQIAFYQEGKLTSTVGDLVKYFDDANDLYKIEYLERHLVAINIQNLQI